MKHLYDFTEDFDGEITINNKSIHLMVTADDILSIVQKGIEEAKKSWLVGILDSDVKNVSEKDITLEKLEQGIWIRAEDFMLLEKTGDFAYCAFKVICDHLELWVKADEKHLPDDLISGALYVMSEVSKLTGKDCNDILLCSLVDMPCRPLGLVDKKLHKHDPDFGKAVL